MGRLVFVTLPGRVLGLLMLAAVAINCANVVGRYLFGRALFWAEETMVFLTIWGVFLGMAAIAYDGRHLAMDLVSSRIRGRWRLLLNGFMTAVLVACCLFVVVQSWTVVSLFASTGSVSVAAGVPKAVPHSALLAGFALTLLAVLFRLRAHLRGEF